MTSQLFLETTTPLRVPDLWVLSAFRSSTLHDVSEIFHYLGVSKERTVAVSDTRHLRPFAGHTISLLGVRDAAMWNAGLDYIRRQQHGTSTWDVLLLDPGLPISHDAANSLRHHMRMTDVWMAEPDVFGSLESLSYQSTFVVNPAEVPPTTVMVTGENDVRFDAKYFDDSDSWVEFCHRTCVMGGTVRVSSRSLKERVS